MNARFDTPNGFFRVDNRLFHILFRMNFSVLPQIFSESIQNLVLPKFSPTKVCTILPKNCVQYSPKFLLQRFLPHLENHARPKFAADKIQLDFSNNCSKKKLKFLFQSTFPKPL